MAVECPSGTLEHLAEQSLTENLLTIDKEEPLKTLDLLWNSSPDTLQYQIDLPKGTVNTKRTVLSRIAQIMWPEQLEWAQELPQEHQELWGEYYSALPQLNDIQIPRNVVAGNNCERFDLFGFGDASERAFGACLSAVSVNSNGVTHSSLLCTKSKVEDYFPTKAGIRSSIIAHSTISDYYKLISANCKTQSQQLPDGFSHSSCVGGLLQHLSHETKH